MPSSITLTVYNLEKSTSFFLEALKPLNYVYKGRTGDTIGFGTPDAPVDFWISQETPGVPAGAAHVAFPAVSQKNVHEFFSAALNAGGRPRVRGEPACRDAASGYYSAAVIDYDGNSIEAVFRPDLVADSSDESRPSSMSSVGSVQSRSGMSQKTPTVVSKASTMKSQQPDPSDARGSASSRAPTQVSNASSRAPTSVSRTPSQVQSRAATQVSQAPSPSSSRTPNTIPDGNTIAGFVTEARGAVAVAKELASHVRPVLANSTSSPAVIATGAANSAQSHQPSDTIVGTLLGVAAGAALHYAYSKATKTSPPPNEQQQSSRRATPVRTSTDSSLYNTNKQTFHRPYAIESPPSDSGYVQRQFPQRYITMEDHNERLSDYTKAPSTIRPRRRSSFSGVGSINTASPSESRASRAGGGRYIEAPPTSYKAPTAITQAETHASGRSSSRSRSKSRVSSVLRAASLSSSSRRSRYPDSDNEDQRSSARAQRTSVTGSQARSTRSRAPSVDARSEARTVVPINSKPPSQSPSKAPSRAPSRTSKTTTTRPPESYHLPPSRAGTWAAGTGSDAGTFFSTHSRSAKTAIGKMVEEDKKREREAMTSKSVVGKLGDVRRLDLPSQEVAPSDSVSQVSSNRTGRSRR